VCGCHNVYMKPNKHNLEYLADRRMIVFVVLFTALSWIVLSTSEQLEAVRTGDEINWIVPWLTEFTSHFVLICVALVIPVFLARWPLSLENWQRRVPVYIACFFVFSTIHILLMVAMRSAMFPFFLGESYEFGLMNPSVWVYEFRKDLMTFILVLSGFLTSRHIAQLQLEADGARHEARETGRLTLKSGGRTVFLKAEELVWAKSASNYVELHTQTGEHLIRMTLSNLDTLLSEAGDGHVRTHRSYLVQKSSIREIVPTGNGDAKVVLKNETSIPASRKYRPGLVS